MGKGRTRRLKELKEARKQRMVSLKSSHSRIESMIGAAQHEAGRKSDETNGLIHYDRDKSCRNLEIVRFKTEELRK